MAFPREVLVVSEVLDDGLHLAELGVDSQKYHYQEEQNGSQILGGINVIAEGNATNASLGLTSSISPISMFSTAAMCPIYEKITKHASRLVNTLMIGMQYPGIRIKDDLFLKLANIIRVP